jgi:hypothetical protein
MTLLAELEPVVRLKRDVAAAAASLTLDEARWAVDTYYQIQKFRVGTNNRVKGLDRDAVKAGTEPEPHLFLGWTLDQLEVLEKQMVRGLAAFAAEHPVHPWLDSIVGIGPVLSAGLIAHLELRPTVGAWYRFAGLDPTMTWAKGEKRPWNTTLKTLCWKIGDSFVKVSGRDDAYYGRAYVTRKIYEIERNKPELMVETVAKTLAEKKFSRDTQAKRAYDLGILPPGRIDLRARRWATKLFLSHLHEVWWRLEHNGEMPPAPFAIARLGHADYLPPPNLSVVGLS